MPYQPVINELGPRLIADGYEGAAKYKLAGAEALSNGISSAGQNLGQGISKAILTSQEIQQLGGEVETMQKAGYIGEDDVAKFNEAGLGKKRGMVGEWKATSNLLRAKDLDTFRTDNQMRQDSNMAGVQGANAATVAQLKSGTEPPKYDRVTLADGRVAFVAPNAPTKYPTDPNGGPLKAQVPVVGGGLGGLPPRDPAAPVPSGSPAPGGAPPPQFQEGQIVKQGGKRYQYSGGQFVEIP